MDLCKCWTVVLGRQILKFTFIVYILGLLIWLVPFPALAATNYTAIGALPKEPDSTFKSSGSFMQMANIKIKGTAKDTFANVIQPHKAEFRLPNDFYICTVSSAAYSANDVVVEAGIGLNQDSIKIQPIAEDPDQRGHYRGFELTLQPTDILASEPELILHFKKVFVPRGYTGNVGVTVEVNESSGFSEGNFTIGIIDAAKLTVQVEKLNSLAGNNNRVGPIKISENMGGAFNYVELTLPAGFTWITNTGLLKDPSLGLRSEDGKERTFDVSVSIDKYGHSVMLVKLKGPKSTTSGKLSIECDVDIDESTAAYGGVLVRVDGDADPTPTSLNVGTYTKQTVSVTAGQARNLYGGVISQDVAEISITENAPDSLKSDRTITLYLPSWAKWAENPTIQVEGGSTLDLRAPSIEDEGKRLQLSINSTSGNKPAVIRIKDLKVNVPVDAVGDLNVKVGGTAGATGEVIIGKVSLPLTLTAIKKPDMTPGQQGQAAGDIEIKEALDRVLLYGQLWVNFPDNVYVNKTPEVKVTAGDLKLGQPTLNESDGRQRLVIPINCSSSSASTLLISNIVYDINQLALGGDVTVEVGGPAVDEVNYRKGSDGRYMTAIFPEHEWLPGVSNAAIHGGQEQPVKTQLNVVFKLDDKSYEVNGQKYEMDVAPYLVSDRTFIPLRYAGLALGVLPENIQWDSANQMAYLLKDGVVVQVKIGEMGIYCSGIKLPLDAPAHIKDGRTMVPLRAISSSLGATVNWDGATKTINITF